MDNIQSNLSKIEKRMLETKELNARLAKSSNKREILKEVQEKDRKEKINKMKIAKARQQLMRKIGIKVAIFGSCLTVIGAGAYLIKNKSSEVKQPIYIVSHDMLANANLLESDNGKKVSPIEFDKTETNELYEYIEENKMTDEQIEKKVDELIEKNGIENTDFAKEKLSELYPEVFDQPKTR